MEPRPLLPTERLHYDDPLSLEFSARVIAVRAAAAGQRTVILDRSGFYPESGGQPPDQGRLGTASVVDVQVDDDGLVHHRLAEGEQAPEVGAEVAGSIDAVRRRLHMALHTGQHLLSRALLDVAGAETTSARLSGSSCSIDVDLERIDDRRLGEAEELVNAIVEENRRVRQWFPEQQELASLALRRPPKVASSIRVVAIEGFDVSPCGGTHCRSTAEVGPLFITGTERVKGRLRVAFLAGRAARHELRRRSETLVDLGRAFTTGPNEVRSGVEKLREDLRSARESLGNYRHRVLSSIADDALARAAAEGRDRLLVVLEGEPLESVRLLAARFAAVAGKVALVVGREREGEGTAVLVRGDGAAFDCGRYWREVLAPVGARGGGRPERAEGRVPAGVELGALFVAR